jgi:hypothetical protein
VQRADQPAGRVDHQVDLGIDGRHAGVLQERERGEAEADRDDA